MTPTRTAVLALIAAALAGPALAQAQAPSATQNLNQNQTRSLAPSSGAAATLPNTFDGPPAAATPAPRPAPAAAPVQVTDAEMAEAALRTVIEQFRTGDIDEALFTPGVATQLNAELANYRTLIRGYGDVQSIEAQGAANGVGQFLVVFDNAATQWQVGLEDGGLVAALRFREAPPESSEPPAPGA